MPNTPKKHFSKKISKVKHKYCGILNEKGFRVGAGCQLWFKEDFTQKYSGQFFYNNLQNQGIYLSDKKGDQIYCDGLFYNNKLEGYGKVVYPNYTIFEGLFKQHNRFGPGIVTHSDNTQDVGIWEGSFLRRVAVPIGTDFIPRLGQGSVGKAKLLKFRNLVPVCPQFENPAKKIFTDLNVTDTILSESHQLYNANVRNCDSLFFNASLYDDNFTRKDCIIDVIITQQEFEEISLKSEHTEQEFEEVSLNSEHTEQEFKELSLNSEHTEQDLGNKLETENTLSCTCFQQNVDRFQHICVQLHDVEIKLQELSSKRELLQHQLQLCKSCCQKMNLIRHNNTDDRKEEEILKSSSKEDFRKPDSQKVLSFCYLSSDESQENESKHDLATKSEIEIRNYLYTTSVLFIDHDNCDNNDEHLSHEKLSKATLPFSHRAGSQSDPHTPRKFSQILGYDIEHEFEGNDTPEIPVCYCDVMLVDNIDIIQKKLKSLNQEEMFYGAVKIMLKKCLDVEFEKLDHLQEETRFIKKVTVTDLLAWNNETIWTSMLQHCFQHRHSEDNVIFNVADLLTGRRDCFGKAGIYETDCIQFLQECTEGHQKNALKYFRMSNINPDLCDVRGNTGLMLATIGDKTNMIEVLTNCGANLDAMNDEGLTPLTISFLKYLSFKFKVCNWEKAFLQDADLTDINLQQWRSAGSVSSLYNSSSNDIKCESNEKSVSTEKKLEERSATSELNSKTIVFPKASNKAQEYLFKMNFIRISHENQLENKKSKKRTVKKSTKKKRKNKSKEHSENGKKIISETGDKSDLKQETSNTKLEASKKTIMTLLNFGSDPNIGIVPLQPVFLTIFTDDSDFMNALLKSNADPNTTISETNLTCLHVIASLKLTSEKVKMCDILLKHKADPNVKTSSEHWAELSGEILGEISKNVPNEGKNVLHVLSLREDYLEDTDDFFGSVAELLVFNGCKTTDFYLGHTPLSLAVLRRNIKLIEALLKTKQVDPHQVLENEMGNALTVLLLNRFSSIFPLDMKKTITQTLLENGLNPLNKVGAHENVISFMESENQKVHLQKISNKEIYDKNVKKSVKKTSKKSTVTSRKKRSKNRSKMDDTREKGLESIEDYIIEAARKILFRHLQAKAVKCLYILIKETLVGDPLVSVLAKFITPDEAVNIIHLLFQNGILKTSDFNCNAICDMLEFIKMKHNLDKELNDYQKTKELEKSKSWKGITFDRSTICLPQPEVDENTDKYNICFHCLKSEGKKLLKCPVCEVFYFCSEECNRKSRISEKYHKCDLLFYDAQEKILETSPEPNRLNILLEMATKLKNERSIMLKLKNTQEEILKLKLIPHKKKQEAANLLETLIKFKKDREDFACANNLWYYTVIFMHEHENVDKKQSQKLNVVDRIMSDIYRYPSNLPMAQSSSAMVYEPKIVRPLLSASAVGINIKKDTSLNITQNALSAITPKFQPSYLPSSKRSLIAKLPSKSEEPLTTKLDQRHPETTESAEKRKTVRRIIGKEYYIKLLSNIFADFNLPLLLLPYACYKDGQVYYRMSADSSQLGSGFYKLNIPD